MPKLKTHKGLAKRIKVTKNKKLKRRQAFHRHLMAAKSGSRRRRTKGTIVLSGGQAKAVARLLNLR